MARNHKKIVLETVQKIRELGLAKSVKFNNYNAETGEFFKPYMTEIQIEGQVVKGLQAWNNSAFYTLTGLLSEYKNGNLKLEKLCDMLSNKRTDAITVKADGTEHKEYAHDSYRWGQVDLMDKWYSFIDKYTMQDDFSCEFETYLQKEKAFLLNVLAESVACCPDMNGWNASRLNDYYITSKILPKFIREQLKIMASDEQIQELANDYKNRELFADSLHRLIGDEKVKDDLFFKMGLLG